MKQEKNKAENLILIGGILILTGLISYFHYKIPFMMDDMWYSTNLATDKPLQNFGDIIESQVWHFLHWGGRNITHGILQLTLMAGDTIANIINVIMTLLLGWLICVLAGQKNPLWILLSLSAMIACNPNIRMSMFWQAGCANYVYSTAWILFFLWVYLRETGENEARKLPLAVVWMIPLGIITGWSNENMGPASFCIAVAVMIYLWKFRKRKLSAWMFTGAISSLIGCGFVILAPGNFARSSALPDVGIIQTLYERLVNMLRAGGDFLFPSAILLALVLVFYVGILKEKLKPFQWFLLAHAILSYGAMILSPHYPDRATFGTMCVCITLTISMLGQVLAHKKEYNRYLIAMTACFFLYAVWMLVYSINTLSLS